MKLKHIRSTFNVQEQEFRKYDFQTFEQQQQELNSGAYAYLSSKLLNLWFNGTAFTFPVNTGGTTNPGVYIGFYTTTPSATAGSGTEASGGNYVRIGINNTTVTAFPSIGSTIQIITNNITIGTAAETAALGTITGIAILDSSATGNGLFFGDLSASKVLGVNDIIQFLAANLSIQLL